MKLLHTDEHIDWAELSELYRLAPLGNKSPVHLRKVFGNSLFKCFAVDGSTLIGAGRALADGGDCSYICDIAVLPAYQGQGLGRTLVADLLEKSRGYRKVILYSVPGNEHFYARLGFRRMRTAMAVFDDPVAAAKRGYLDET